MQKFNALTERMNHTRDDASTPSDKRYNLLGQVKDLDGKDKSSTTELDHLEFSNENAQFDEENNENCEEVVCLNATEEAEEANLEEKSMTLTEALAEYPKAAGWSMLVATTLIMEGYDTALLNALFALPIFQRKFGSQTSAGTYEISSQWQVGLNMCVYTGEIIGLQMTGFLVDHMGTRYTMILALSLLTMYIFILYYCKNLAMIAVGQILSAMPWGAFQSLAVAYASEVCPLALRYYMTTYSNICWLCGQILAAGIMKNSEKNLADSELGYKIPFALQWVWPAPLAVGIFLAPESPWWLVRKNRLSDARKSLRRILSGDSTEKEIKVEITFEQIKLTIEKERKLKEKPSSFFDCFKGVDGRRTRIACLTWMAQGTSGSILLGYSTYFLLKAGMATSDAFTFSVFSYCLGLAGTLCSWAISGKIGRWTILTSGLVVQMVILIIIGGLGFSTNPNASWGSGSLLLALSFFYNAGIGPVVYCIVAEIPSAELRTQTIVLARNCYNLTAVVNSVLTPYMLNASDWNWGAKSGLYWGAMTALTLVWVIIDLPETSGRTFSDIDELFAQKVPARKFKSTTVDPFRKAENLGPPSDEVSEEASFSRVRHESLPGTKKAGKLNLLNPRIRLSSSSS
ncbi:hypothetical protein HG537_0F00180 [Torulaspora globosa]|uniref:Major facilitator superfamily (MFS) profile domain-containing protein n=1 Tax=Torulaspora globosa TaxID=48254 RepID=A0A7H9HWU5_9SACH|nr:hypothetical protein HG537_0F00180 [Torulaspora sp. CBS 2947]